MAIVTISRGSYKRGKEVAEQLAKKLGYQCISREQIIETSKDFNVPEVMLLKASQYAPTVFGKYIHAKEKYLAFIENSLLEHFRKDNVVYHGFAGHFYFRQAPHILRVRIIADIEDRINIVMANESLTRKDAIKFIEKVDEERVKWSQYFYGLDIRDASLYDLIINIKKLTIDDAIQIITNTIQLQSFTTTPESQQIVEDMYLASKVKMALIDKYHDAKVTVEKGIVDINVRVADVLKEEMKMEIESIVKAVSGVQQVRVHRMPFMQY